MSVFDSIYKNNLWFNGSGTGSISWNNGPFLEYLQTFINQNNINSILEIGCGDFRLWNNINFTGKYLGLDVVSTVIEKNKKIYGNEKREFRLHNIIENPMSGDWDLILIKDLQIHLSNKDRTKLLLSLDQIKRRFLICCEDWHYLIRDYDISTGFYRPIDLGSEAFETAYYERTYVLWICLWLALFIIYRRKLFLVPIILSVPQKRIYLFS